MRTYEEINAELRHATSINDVNALESLAVEMQAIDSPEAQSAASSALGTAAHFTGNYPAALEYYRRALAQYEKLGNRANVAQMIVNIGVVHSATGDHSTAMTHFSNALTIHQELGNRAKVAHITGNMGSVYWSTGDFPAALKFSRTALALHEELDNLAGMARDIHVIGNVYRSTGNYPAALEHYLRALALYEELGNSAGVARITGNIGDVYLSTGEFPVALNYYIRSLTLHREKRDRVGEAVNTGNIGSVYLSTEDFMAALEHFERALALHEAMGDSANVARVSSNIVQTLLKLNRHDEASELLERQTTMTIDNPIVLAEHKANRAMLAERNGDLDAALNHLMDALSISSEAGVRSDVAEYHLRLRDLAQKRNDFAGYVEHNNEYQRITEEINGKATAQKLAMMEAQKQIDAERQEKEKHRALLHNTLPPSIADRVLRGEQVNDTYENAVVLFMDLVGFTTMSSTMDPGNVVSLMNEIFTTCDEIIATHGLMKIKTIGDSYMAVAFPPQVPHVVRDDSTTAHQASGDGVIPSAARNIAECAAHAALEMLQTISQVRVPTSSPEGSPESSHVRVRLGLHCGPLTAGVIGTERLQYDAWGDTVNVASRMESTSEPGRIHVSEAFATSLGLRPRNDSSSPGSDERKSVIPNEVWNEEPGTWHLALRGETELKGKGTMTTYWLEPA